MPESNCPSETDLKAFVLGELPEALHPLVSAHLEACPRCEAIAQQLDDFADPIIRAVRLAQVQTLGDDATTVELKSAAATAMGAIGLPERVGDYTILEQVGRGGMGVVYKARQTKPSRLVAIKMILAGSHARTANVERFLKDAETIASLQHPNIVQVYKVEEHEGKPFFSLEYCGGGNLAQKLKATPLPGREAALLVQTLARAIQAAHEKGIIHRDLKPGNVLLTDEGVLKITDFGLAKNLDVSGPTMEGDILGTPSYMAPEQAAGLSKEIGAWTDVYALGAILYECLTGRPPFKAASNFDTVMQVLRDDPVPPRLLQSMVPRDLETICLQCLQRAPDKRYPSALELAEDLQRFLKEEPIKAKMDSLSGRLRSAIESYKEVPTLDTAPAAIWAGAIVFVLHAAIFFLAWFDRPVYQVWLTCGLYLAANLVVLWRYHLSRYPVITVVERQSLTISLATMVLTAFLMVILGPLNPVASARDSLVAYPAVVVLGGMASFMHGMTHWGRFYIIGLAHIPLAVALRLVPDWAPLIYAILASLALCWAGARLPALMTRREIQ
jgi:serine/threonine protein kinase